MGSRGLYRHGFWKTLEKINVKHMLDNILPLMHVRAT